MNLIKIISLLFSLIFLTTGCFSYKEINNLAIVNAIGISKNNDEFTITLQILNTKKTSSIEFNKPTVLSSTGKNIFDAISKTSLKSSKIIQLSHLDLLVIDEALAKKGLLDFLDYLVRDNISSKDFNIVVTKDNNTPENILKTINPLDISSLSNINKSIELSDKTIGYTKLTKYDDLIKELTSKGTNPTIGGITNQPSANVSLDGIAIFRHDKLIGWLDEEYSNTFNLILGNIKKTVINIPCDNNFIGIGILDTKSNIKATLKNNTPNIDIKIKLDASINELNCNINLELEKNIKSLENSINNNIKENILNLLNLVKKKYKSDIFGFGNLIYKKYPSYFKDNEDTWNEFIFPNIITNIEVDSTIINKGNVRIFEDRK